MSFMERAKINFKDHQWEIIAPGTLGLAALVGTIVFLVSNPFGWMISAGILGTMIAAASLNAIAGIGYSIYQLTKDPQQIKNSVTDETTKPKVESQPENKPVAAATQKEPVKPTAPRTIDLRTPPQTTIDLRAVEQAAPKQVVRKKVKRVTFTIPLEIPASTQAAVQAQPTGLKARMKDFASTIWNHPTKSALAFGSLLLAGYGLYNYWNAATVVGSAIADHLPSFSTPALPVPELPVNAISSSHPFIQKISSLFSALPASTRGVETAPLALLLPGSFTNISQALGNSAPTHSFNPMSQSPLPGSYLNGSQALSCNGQPQYFNPF